MLFSKIKNDSLFKLVYIVLQKKERFISKLNNNLDLIFV
jgi:hypothetical protein